MSGIGPGRHPGIGPFPLRDGVLTIGGIPLPRLAQRVGSTPFFAYDRQRLTARIGALRAHLPAGIAINYAIKANPMPAVVQHLAHLVDGFDVASAGEMITALDTPVPATRISFAGPGKTDVELAQAVAADVTLHVESEGELARLVGLASGMGMRPRIALRVNPDFRLKGAGMQMGGSPQQFGIDAERVPNVLARLGNAPVEFVGFHVYGGSQVLSLDGLKAAQEQTVELVRRLAAQAPAPVRHLNLGGGFGIPYFPADVPLDLPAVGQHLAGLLAGLRADLPDARLIIELGRYIVGECGIYVSRIVDRKDSRGQVFLVTDGGLHHHLAASGNFGQVIRRNFPVAIGTRMEEPACETVSIVGCLCTPLDLLADRVYLPRADVGDLVVIFQSGAYGFSASPTAFLGHPPPAQVLV
jgi:diaminopimelate decarboxylase